MAPAYNGDPTALLCHPQSFAGPEELSEIMTAASSSSSSLKEQMYDYNLKPYQE